jgi:hypothetical protein
VRVPPVSGQRRSIDRNFNGVLDGEEASPSLTAVRSGTGVTISWPTNSVGIILEFSAKSFLAPRARLLPQRCRTWP